MLNFVEVLRVGLEMKRSDRRMNVSPSSHFILPPETDFVAVNSSVAVTFERSRHKFRFLETKGNRTRELSYVDIWSMRHVGRETSLNCLCPQTAADVDER